MMNPRFVNIEMINMIKTGEIRLKWWRNNWHLSKSFDDKNNFEEWFDLKLSWFSLWWIGTTTSSQVIIDKLMRFSVAINIIDKIDKNTAKSLEMFIRNRKFVVPWLWLSSFDSCDIWFDDDSWCNILCWYVNSDCFK